MWGAGGDQLAAEGGGWRLGGGQALNWISVLGELSVGESIDWGFMDVQMDCVGGRFDKNNTLSVQNKSFVVFSPQQVRVPTKFEF